MIRQLLTYGTKFCAVEHTVDSNSAETFYVLQLNKSRKELAVNNKEQFFSKPKLFRCLKAQKHLFLIVNNQQVLLKKIDAVVNEDSVVKTAFPNIKISDFYYEISQNEKQNFVTVCRKTYIDNLITEYQTKGIAVIGFSLQNLAITSLVPFFNQSQIITSNSLVSISDKMIYDIKKSELAATEYKINDLKISSNYVLVLSGILSYFYNNTRNASNFENVEKELKKHYKNYRFHAVGIKSALGVVFFVLLINFLFFSNAHSKMTTLNREVLINTSSKNTLLQLQNRVYQKIRLTKNINALSSSKTTWYLNELAKSVPVKLQLSVIDFQPVSKSIKKEKEIIVKENTILVKGISKNNNSFSNWTAELGQKDWIEKVVIISHGKGNSKTSTFEFSIKIKS